MKTFYKWFDYFLNLLLVSSLVAVALDVYLYANYNNNLAWSQFFPKEGSVLIILLLLTFVFGLLYIVLGIILWVVNVRKTNTQNVSLAKRIFFKGLLRSVLSFVLYFFFSLALSFFGLSLGNCMCLPKIQDPNTPGFPVEDLTITDRKAVAPQISGDSWSCDLTIRNNSAKMTAAWFSFNNADENTEDDSISPGETKVINVYANDNFQTACKGISINSAEIAPASSNINGGDQDITSPTPPPGFPVEDLTITDRKPIAPQSASGLWACDLTIYNSNPTLSVTKITFTNADEAYLPQGDTIASGKTTIIRVVSDKNNSGDICPVVSIESAEIVNDGN